MSLKLILLEEIKAHLIRELFLRLRERLFFAHLQAGLPRLPALAVLSLLDRHKERIVAEPVGLFFKKCFIFSFLRRRADVKVTVHAISEPLIGFPKKGITVLIHCAVVNLFIIRTKPDRLAFLPGKESVADQLLEVYKIGISGKGGYGLVRAVAKSGLAEWKHLPCALPGIL